jgi:hypothetical protein
MSTNLLNSIVTEVYKQKDDNIVANLSLYNPSTATQPLDASMDVSLEKPLLHRMSDYKLTIARFRVPLGNIFPSFDLRNLVFQVTFTYNGTPYSSSVTVNNVVYTISEFVNLVNGIMFNAYSGIPLPQNTTPYILYQDDLFYFVFPTAFNGSVSLSNDLYYYLGGLPAKPSTIIQGGYDLYLNQKQFYLSPFYDMAGAPLTSSASGLTKYNAYIVNSEFSTSNRFNDIQSIILATNIPIRQEQLPQVTNPGLGSQLAYISTFGILSDYSVMIDKFGQQYEDLIFYPQSEFRWIDLLSDNQLDRLSFKFYYQTANQTINKMFINPGESCSIKIYFVSKKKFFAYKGYDGY